MSQKGFNLAANFLISSPNIYGSVNFIVNCRSPLHFLSVFRCLGTKSVANCNSREKLKLELGNINGLDDALSLYETMAETRPLPSVNQFNQLLSRVVNLKQYPVAIRLFKDVCRIGVSVDEYTMTIAINSYCLSHRVDFG
ncbi:hypothetical protein MIMGU_mgv11b0020782mg, partial [Erythranthe guttata]